jgi:undecaprenyl-diphosphatase
MEHVLALDRTVFFWLNSMHWPWLDLCIYHLTNILTWTPLILFLLYLTVRIFRIKALTVIVAVALLITASDQLSVLVKSDVGRPRPSNDPQISSMVHTVNGYKGGLYGFYSSHASNTFAVAMFLSLVLGRRIRYISWVLFLWAFLMSYTRIYLGLHYPLDILSGACAGLLLGWFTGRITLWVLSLQGENPVKG